MSETDGDLAGIALAQIQERKIADLERELAQARDRLSNLLVEHELTARELAALKADLAGEQVKSAGLQIRVDSLREILGKLDETHVSLKAENERLRAIEESLKHFAAGQKGSH